VRHRPERFIKKGQTIGPCWICGGQLEVLTNGMGSTRITCPTCQPRLTALEEVAQRVTMLGTFAQQARLAELVPWQKKCAVCAVPIPTKCTYCDICRGPTVKKLTRDYMREYRRRVKTKEQCEALTVRGDQCRRHALVSKVNDHRLCNSHARLERAGRARYMQRREGVTA